MNKHSLRETAVPKGPNFEILDQKLFRKSMKSA